MTACASVLACHDTLATIFDHLAPGSIKEDNIQDAQLRRKLYRRTLVSSAVLCTTISRHSLNVLWRELDNIHPLLKVLPNYKQIGSRFMLSGTIIPEDWARVRLYADRVRILHALQGESEDSIQPSLWVFLATRCKGSPLMPRLRRLVAHNVPIPHIPALLILISPTLRMVEFSFALEDEADADSAPHVVDSLLHTLPFSAPDLEHVSYDVNFSLSRRPITLCHGYLTSFGLRFSTLKTLSIGCEVDLHSHHVLQSLSSIPTLQSLTCSLVDLPSESAPALPRCRFEQLTHLQVGGPLNHLIAIFQACQLPRLASIDVQTTRPSNPRETRDLWTEMWRVCDPTLLTSFSLEASYVFARGLLPPASLVEYFEPLLAFPNISTFQFYSIDIIPSVHDDDLTRFGDAWPRLQVLRISHLVGYSLLHSTVSRQICPTLSGLVELARRCPLLNTLDIPELDTTVVPGKNTVPLFRHRLRHLTMGNIMATVPSKVYMDMAVIIDRIFPAIDLDYARYSGTCPGRGWKSILRFVEAMRLGRETAGLCTGFPEKQQM